MRIVFICGSLEPGRDGVGDYTRRLAAECIRQGHACGIIAFHDAFVNDAVSLSQSEGDIRITALRLSQGLTWSNKTGRAKAWTDAFDPDWISLQFVPYAFHLKGIPWALVGKLSLLARGRKCHVMLHEIWIGFTRIASFRHRLVGVVQKRLILRILKVLPCRVVHTSNHLYRLVLEDSGIQAGILKLFSNIPQSEAGLPWMQTELQAIGICPDNRKDWHLLGVFGSVHPDSGLLPSIRAALAEVRSKGKKLAFLGVGRSGSVWTAVESELNDQVGCDFLIQHFGEQSESRISAFLQTLDSGLATMPKEFMGKSGTVAAMLAHGVPLRSPWKRGIPEYTDRMPDNEEPLSGGYSPSQIAHQFTQSLMHV